MGKTRDPDVEGDVTTAFPFLRNRNISSFFYTLYFYNLKGKCEEEMYTRHYCSFVYFFYVNVVQHIHSRDFLYTYYVTTVRPIREFVVPSKCQVCHYSA